MLDFLRRKAQSTVIQVTIVAIILVFVFWGVGTNQGTGPNAVATVNDEMISYQEYQRVYDQRVKQLQAQFGGNIPAGLFESLGIKDQVLEGLIQRALVRQGAEEAGLMVSDWEVRKAIQDMEAFKNNGAFDSDWYQQILAGNRMSPTEFEASMKADLLAAKVTDHVSRFGGVSDGEIKERFAYDYRQKRFTYAELSATGFKKKVDVNDENLAAFFDERKESYRGEVEVKLKYILFPFDDSANLEVPESEIIGYYESHKDEYVVPEKRQARHILVKVEESDSEDVVTEKRKKAEGLLKQLREGNDFAELAKKYSDDKGSALNGGDLGLFGRGQMVKPFEDAVFGLEEGGLTLTRSKFGFHVIRLEKITSLELRAVDQVREEIVAKIRKDGGKDLAFKKADAVYEKIILSGSLEKFAESGELTVKETGFFNRRKPSEPLKSNPAFQEAVFSLNQGELSSIVEGAKSYGVFFAQEIMEPQVPELTEVRDRVKEDYVRERSRELAMEAAESLLASLKDGASLEEEAAKIGIETTNSPFLSRSEKGGTKLPPAVIESGLTLTAGNSYPEKVETVGQTFYVMVFKDVKDATAELFEEKKEELKDRLLDEKKEEILSDWAAFLRGRAEVVIDQRFN